MFDIDYKGLGINSLETRVPTPERFHVGSEVLSKDKAIEIVHVLAEQFRDEIDSEAQIYLFGSTAKGSARSWSDIDVAIISDRFQGYNSTPDIFLYSPLVNQVCTAIEIHTYTPDQWDSGVSHMVAEIINTGVKI